MVVQKCSIWRPRKESWQHGGFRTRGIKACEDEEDGGDDDADRKREGVGGSSTRGLEPYVARHLPQRTSC